MTQPHKITEAQKKQESVYKNTAEALSKLMLLKQSVRNKRTMSELGFTISNDTYKVVPFRQCIFWVNRNGKPKVRTVSGLSDFEDDSPFLIWLERLIKSKMKDVDPKAERDYNFDGIFITAKDLDEKNKEDWLEWVDQNSVLMFFISADKEVIGGLWLTRNDPLTEPEKRLLSQACDTYSFSLDSILTRRKLKSKFITHAKESITNKKFVYALLLTLFLFPVRLSATAPAEIVARDPFIVSSPMEGTIKDIMVRPNETVEEGDLLFTFDSTSLENRVEIVASELGVIQANLEKASRQAFSDPKSKGDIAIFRAQLRAKKEEFRYTQELLTQSEVRAVRSGIAIYTDPNALRGVPVVTGERIMMISDAADSELQIRVPADQILKIDRGVKAKFYLNINPLDVNYASIQSVSFEATPDPDGLLTYKVKAAFDNAEKRPIIGLKGTAKVYGGFTIFGYQVLRRPLAVIRRYIGL